MIHTEPEKELALCRKKKSRFSDILVKDEEEGKTLFIIECKTCQSKIRTQ